MVRKFALVALILLAHAAAAEQLFKPMGQTPTANGLSTTFTLVKSEFGPGESICGTWTFTNNSDRPLLVNLNRTGWFNATFSIRKDGKALATPRASELIDRHYPISSYTLEPGASQRFLIDLRALDWDAPKWCDTLGNYEVQLIYCETKTAWAKLTLSPSSGRKIEIPELPRIEYPPLPPLPPVQAPEPPVRPDYEF
jgi:hypothetical protein